MSSARLCLFLCVMLVSSGCVATQPDDENTTQDDDDTIQPDDDDTASGDDDTSDDDDDDDDDDTGLADDGGGRWSSCRAPPEYSGTGVSPGQHALDFEAPDQFGDPIRLACFADGFTLLVFDRTTDPASHAWAGWAAPMLAKFRSVSTTPGWIIEILIEGAPEGAPASPAQQQQWALTHGLDLPVLGGAAAQALEPLWAIEQSPTFVLLYPDLSIADRWSGWEDSRAELIVRVTDALEAWERSPSPASSRPASSPPPAPSLRSP